MNSKQYNYLAANSIAEVRCFPCNEQTTQHKASIIKLLMSWGMATIAAGKRFVLPFNILALVATCFAVQPGLAASQGESTNAKKPIYFQPPDEKTLPNNAFGDLVRKGRDYFMNTKALASEYVGADNELACVNCHLNRGRNANSAPLWAAYNMYPAFRKKNNKVNSFVERIQGCFSYSMNGKPPAADSEVLNALSAYAYWLSSGVPLGKDMVGRGFNEPPPPAGGYDIARGKIVYEKQCAICHGPTGAGQKVGNTPVFPALWGKNSFNWGAGMHRINTAAGFIQHNMPLGRGETLSDQEAWDVAAFINSHERPQDPRLIDGDIEKTRKKFHESDGINLYGTMVNGVLLGQGTK